MGQKCSNPDLIPDNVLNKARKCPKDDLLDFWEWADQRYEEKALWRIGICLESRCEYLTGGDLTDLYRKAAGLPPLIVPVTAPENPPLKLAA